MKPTKTLSSLFTDRLKKAVSDVQGLVEELKDNRNVKEDLVIDMTEMEVLIDALAKIVKTLNETQKSTAFDVERLNVDSDTLQKAVIEVEHQARIIDNLHLAFKNIPDFLRESLEQAPPNLIAPTLGTLSNHALILWSTALNAEVETRESRRKTSKSNR